jgi:hypothetical protein
MKSTGLLLSGLLLLVGGMLLTTTSSAWAHERRAVGEYGFIVGFSSEPAFLNQPNGLDLRVYTVDEGVELLEASSDQRNPVIGLEETLEAKVSFGGEAPLALELEPRFGEEGAYDGHFFPTAMGAYTFHITGTIDGTEIDESFTSGPETFSEIGEPLEYPVQVMTNQELEAQLAAGSESDDKEDSNTMPIALAIAGIVVGGAGLAAGGLALTRGRA